MKSEETVCLFPGSRWWKFDFHTHTPASGDTNAWHAVVGTKDEIAPEKWLLKFMAAEIDCVVVTDHNSGAWIERLKEAYSSMKTQADEGQAPGDFRSLTIFPGVEISANGGVHVLAIFDPSATSSDIDSLLGAVEYRGTKGDCDGETGKSVAEVITAILKAGAIPIPAHADTEKGLLRVNPGTRECALSSQTIRQALEVDGLLAVEWRNLKNQNPKAVEKAAEQLARVLGSDCHSFQGQNSPGSCFTWVKMASPTLEGLRLALLDGNGVSLKRSDERAFDPFKTPVHVIRSIEIEKGQVIGNDKPARIELSPYFNAIVGGRGTGKSTMVHALRLATRREAEITALPIDSEPRERFEAFCKVAHGRDGEGALRPETSIRVEWQHEETRLRLVWSLNKRGAVEEMYDGKWQESSSQSINASRFPVRILSQGQIAEMAGAGRQTLLTIIDEAAGVESLAQAYEEARRTFFSQQARLREIDGMLAMLPEVERRLKEVEGKLTTLAQTDHAAILQTFARAQYQSRAVEETLNQLREGANTLRNTAEKLLLDDWPAQHFTEIDTDLLTWRQEADALLAQTRQRIEQEAEVLEQGIAKLDADERLATWRKRVAVAYKAHENLQAQLAAQGVADPHAFAELTTERQQLETRLKDLRQLQADRAVLEQQIKDQQTLILQRRQAITKRRQEFLLDKLTNNDYVRIQIAPFGFDPLVVERSMRELIDVTDKRFDEDILETREGKPPRGLAADVAGAPDKITAIDKVRRRLLEPESDFNGKFRNYLAKRWEKPDLVDHVLVWFPEDDLRIEYHREGKWYAISEGSQGQQSAALLAFLLAFGEEPIVLDQPEDDLDNHLIYDLIVRQIRENKLRRQLIVVTHNPNVVINGDAELVHVMEFGRGQCYVKQSGTFQEKSVREEVCRVMEGGREAFARRWKRLGKEV